MHVHLRVEARTITRCPTNSTRENFHVISRYGSVHRGDDDDEGSRTTGPCMWGVVVETTQTPYSFPCIAMVSEEADGESEKGVGPQGLAGSKQTEGTTAELITLPCLKF